MTFEKDFETACEAIEGRLVKGTFGEMVCRMSSTEIKIIEPLDTLFVERWSGFGKTHIVVENLKRFDTSIEEGETKAISDSGSYVKIDKKGKLVVSIKR